VSCAHCDICRSYTEDNVADWVHSHSDRQHWQQQQQQQPELQDDSANFRTIATLMKMLSEESSSEPSPWHVLFDAATATAIHSAAASASGAHSLLEQHLNFSLGQGHSGQLPFLTLSLAALSMHASSFCQTGFNSGHSAVTALASNAAISVLSFDLGEEAAVAAAASYIDSHHSYRGRHELVLGDSRDTVVAASSARPRWCDVSFVDGGHFGDVPLSDILALALMSHQRTLLVVDDTPFLRDVEAAWCALRNQAS
jgi:hypothetical protein